ncbi:MMPL family transporter [Streptomyces qinglanensis]|uniref:Putative drug exporter of the RND superfamily n=1 Tax=Streptomyces qinglanensis TaxID=943816 RepID=A0A1H9V2Q1_9ACTN|nr:MMPL family transporter [Streptomyces qinglanensis]SES15527.1 putative drug exporter of the RND superfamily [Streptomyces qinglanensis]
MVSPGGKGGTAPESAGAGRLRRLGEWCARHCVLVLVLWLVALGGLQALKATVGGTYSDDFTVSSAQSQQGLQVLGRADPGAAGVSADVVLHSTERALTSSADAIDSAAGSLRKLPHVLSVQSPLPATPESKPTGALSSNGRTGYLTVRFDTNPTTLDSSYLDGVDSAVEPLRKAGVEVQYGGPLGELARPQADDVRSEGIGFAVAVVVLLVGFGSVLAAGVPLVVALVGVLVGLGCLGLVARAAAFADVAPTLATMIGIGVGIDYALFLLTRHRQTLLDGTDPVRAAGRAVATSGHAVVVSGCTVVVALAGLYASRVSFIGKLGLAAGITVVTAVAGALTLLPALLGLVGGRIDRYRVRTPVAEGGSAPEGADGARAAGGWHRYAQRVERRPWWFLLGGILVVAVLAIPVFSMRLSHIDDGADPPGFTDKKAYDLLSSGFGPGENGPLTVVVDQSAVPGGDRAALSDSVRKALDGTSGTARVTSPEPAGNGDALTATVVPRGGPQDASTTRLFDDLKDEVLPRAVRGYPAHTYVTGTTAAQLDFVQLVSGRLPLIIGVVVALALVIILIVFRGVLVAVKAAVLNLLSIGASYGVLVAVFQWGWGGPALGVSGAVPIESYVPMMMFAIVFGLSMDYEVFLLSRVRAAWERTGDSRGSVAHGLERTARVITCAALIMASVFAAFILTDNIVVKMMGLGLAVSVLIDATIVRLLLVPAVMTLLGQRAWWLPAWLDRLLPRLEPEGEPEAAPGPSPRGSAGH